MTEEGMSKGPEARTRTVLLGVQVCEGASKRRGQGRDWGHLVTEEEMRHFQQG